MSRVDSAQSQPKHVWTGAEWSALLQGNEKKVLGMRRSTLIAMCPLDPHNKYRAPLDGGSEIGQLGYAAATQRVPIFIVRMRCDS